MSDSNGSPNDEARDHGDPRHETVTADKPSRPPGQLKRSDSDEDDPKQNVVSQPLPHDVLFGRGRPLQAHPGNLRFHRIVNNFRDDYKVARKDDKATVTARALAEISTPDHVAPSPRSSISSVSIAEGDNDKDPKKTSDKARVQNTGGRFLKRTPSGTNWIEVSTAEAMEKISHALRGVPRRSSLQESPTEFEASRTGSASSTGKRSTTSSEFATISFSSSQKRSKSKRTPSPASAMSVSLSTPILGTGAGVTQEQLILALAQQQQQQQQIQNQLQLLLLQNQQRQQQLPLPPAAVASQQDPQRLILMQVLAQELLQPQAQQLQQQNWLQQLSLQQLLHRPNPNGDLAHLLQPLPAPPPAAAPTGSTVLSALLQNAQQQQIHPLPAATLAPALLGTTFLSQLRQQRQQSHGSSSSSEESD